MRKKQWMAAALVGLAVILVGVGSGNVKTRQTKKDKQETTQIVSGVQIITEDGKKYYDFQDVKENNYTCIVADFKSACQRKKELMFRSSRERRSTGSR